jgi:starch phosphorylase
MFRLSGSGEECDHGLGNGAAYFMDSLVTLKDRVWRYVLMHSFGLFDQTIGEDGVQLEIPDYWLNYDDPW